MGERLSVRALSAANTGVYDAVMRVSNNKEFGAGGTTYSVDVGNDTASVTVSRTVDDTNNLYEYTIESTATARSRNRKVVAKLVVNQTTGQINLKSIGEADA